MTRSEFTRVICEGSTPLTLLALSTGHQLSSRFIDSLSGDFSGDLCYSSDAAYARDRTMTYLPSIVLAAAQDSQFLH